MSCRITAEWKQWIAENILHRVDHDAIMTVLTRNGFSRECALSEVTEASRHPYVQAGRSLARKLQKRDWVLEVYRRLNAESSGSLSVERRRGLNRNEFFRDYYMTNRPVLIEGAIEDWPALQTWTPQYLKERFATRLVEIQYGRKSDNRYEINSNRHKREMFFGDYVDLVTGAGETNDFYMTANNATRNAEVLKELWDDIAGIPMCLTQDATNKGYFWFGPAGTITPLHHDLTNNFMVQIYGRKQVKIIAAYELPYVYNHHHCFSEVDMNQIDFKRYPMFQEAKIHSLTLAPGEVLFLPVGCWHFVRALEISITMSFTNFQFNNDFSSFYETWGEI